MIVFKNLFKSGYSREEEAIVSKHSNGARGAYNQRNHMKGQAEEEASSMEYCKAQTLVMEEIKTRFLKATHKDKHNYFDIFCEIENH